MVADTLLLDCGNSTCKYRLNQTSGRLATVDEIIRLIDRSRPTRVLVATVSQLGDQLCTSLSRRGTGFCRLRVRNYWQGLALAYNEPETLGIDRWLTLVALAGRKRPAVVIDAGTAMTVDAVDAGDRHLGGYILPGLSLMRRALVDDTFALPCVDLPGRGRPGRNTADCIANGSIVALAGAVEQSIRHFALPRPDVVWTGGDAETIRPATDRPGKFVPELIFEGMMRLIEDSDYMESLE